MDNSCFTSAPIPRPALLAANAPGSFQPPPQQQQAELSAFVSAGCPAPILLHRKLGVYI
jgi:hypothetical protein